MSLDVCFRVEQEICCPKCGETVMWETICEESTGGRPWYTPLEKIGYYVPHGQRTEENDWYGKDMVLSEEQFNTVFEYVRSNGEPWMDSIRSALVRSLLPGRRVTVNANW